MQIVLPYYEEYTDGDAYRDALFIGKVVYKTKVGEPYRRLFWQATVSYMVSIFGVMPKYERAAERIRKDGDMHQSDLLPEDDQGPPDKAVYDGLGCNFAAYNFLVNYLFERNYAGKQLLNFLEESLKLTGIDIVIASKEDSKQFLNSNISFKELVASARKRHEQMGFLELSNMIETNSLILSPEHTPAKQFLYFADGKRFYSPINLIRDES